MLRECGEGNCSISCWEGKLIQPLWRVVWMLLKTLKRKLLYDPEIPRAWAYTLRKWQFKRTHLPMFTATLFPVSRKQPQSPKTDEWIKRRRYIYTVEYSSATKRNEIGPFAEMWMNSHYGGSLKNQKQDFPGGPAVKNLPAKAGDTGSIPGPGGFHTQLSLCSRPVSHSYWSLHTLGLTSHKSEPNHRSLWV